MEGGYGGIKQNLNDNELDELAAGKFPPFVTREYMLLHVDKVARVPVMGHSCLVHSSEQMEKVLWEQRSYLCLHLQFGICIV